MVQDPDDGSQGEDGHRWQEHIWNEVIEEINSDSRVTTPLSSLLNTGLGKSPIEPEIIDRTIRAEKWELGDDWNRETAGVALQLVQHDWVQRSGRLIDETYAQAISGLDLAGVTPSHIYIADRRSEWRNSPIGGFVSTEVQSFLRHAHQLQAVADGIVSEETLDEGETDIITIRKPSTWRTGELAMMKELTYMIYVGVTPPEAIDYWVVERRGVSQSQWAKHWRDRGQATISENVRKAKKKLREERPELANPEGVEIPEYDILP